RGERADAAAPRLDRATLGPLGRGDLVTERAAEIRLDLHTTARLLVRPRLELAHERGPGRAGRGDCRDLHHVLVGGRGRATDEERSDGGARGGTLDETTTGGARDAHDWIPFRGGATSRRPPGRAVALGRRSATDLQTRTKSRPIEAAFDAGSKATA